MLQIKALVKPVDVDIVTSNGKDINDIIDEICDECHHGLESASILRQEIDQYENYNHNYEKIIEILEGKLCHILDLLED